MGLSPWITAARPTTLLLTPACLLPVLAFISKSGHGSWPLGLACLLFMLLLQIATNYANDYADGLSGVDNQRVGPPRAVASGLIAPLSIRRAYAWLLGVSALLGVGIIFVSARFILIFPLLSALYATHAYTSGVAFGHKGWGEVVVFTSYGPAAALFTYWVHANFSTLQSCLAPLFMGLSAGSLATAVLVVNNYRDRHGDKQAGKRTLAVRWPPRFSSLQYRCLLLAPCLFSLLLAWSLGRTGVLLPSFLLSAAFPLWKALETQEGRQLNTVLKQTILLAFVFSLALTAAVLY